LTDGADLLVSTSVNERLASVQLPYGQGHHFLSKLGDLHMKIYVGNMSYSTTEQILQDEFSAFGAVEEVAVINDRETGRPRGFAFVTMTDDDEGRAAIEAMNGVELDGRTLVVNEARPKNNSNSRGGGGFRRDRW